MFLFGIFLLPLSSAYKSFASISRFSLDLHANTYDKEAWKKGYVSCDKEVCEELHGNIPLDIFGTYYKNGHAKFEFGKDKIMHPFDGDGMISAVTFENGKAMFRNRFVRTKGYVQDSRSNKVMNRGTFGTKKKGFFSNFLNINFKNVANTNVFYMDNKILALHEGGLPHYLEADSLHTLGQYTFRGLLKKGSTLFTAHPRFDPKTKRTIAFSTKKGSKTEITVHEFDQNLKQVASRDVKFEGYCFIHDFAVTENYYIFNQAPTELDILPMILGMKSPGAAVQYDATKPSIVHIIPRDGSPAQQITVDGHWLFHIANAYEENNQLQLDFITSKSMQLGSDDVQKPNVPIWMTLDYSAQVPYMRLERYTFTQSTEGKWNYTGSKQLSEQCVELPSVNPENSCYKHQYIYSACGSSLEVPTPPQGLLKTDVETGKEDMWIGEPFEFMGESIFVPRKNGSKQEDDGYIMSTLHDCKNMKSSLILFDAQKITQGPITRIDLPVFLPFGLHGTFANGVTHNFDDITRRFKATKALDTKTWNEVNSGFSGLGISYDM